MRDDTASAEEELIGRIEEVKARLGDSLIILGHHYMTEAVIERAHERGDSLELARKAAASPAEIIVFCGVRFMAESARVLARPEATVIHPDEMAGCPLADTADIHDVREAWEDLTVAAGDSIVPITYINSSLEVKAFTGERDGIVCTSSNAPRIMERAFASRERVFFLPDRHLGLFTARSLGIPDEEIVVWRPGEELGGLIPEVLEKARVILWDGHCHVHTAFSAEDLERVRSEYPGILVGVHPECPEEVTSSADFVGSTGGLIRFAEEAPEGSVIAIGTEINMVARLAKGWKGKKRIIPLRRSLCPNMYRITIRSLAEVLERPGERGVVLIDPALADPAGTALERMIE